MHQIKIEQVVLVRHIRRNTVVAEADETTFLYKREQAAVLDAAVGAITE